MIGELPRPDLRVGQKHPHEWRKAARPLGLATAVLVAAAAAAGAGPVRAAPASEQDIQEIRAELQAVKAESDEAKAAEAARERRIDDLQRRLDIATGVPPSAPSPTEQAQVEAIPAGDAETPTPAKERKFEVYGFAQADYIQDFNRVNPQFDATLRPSRIPTTPGQFGSDGQSIISVRQSRFGVQADQEIGGKDLFVKFEFDLFGTGVDAGQTTFRLRHAYGSWGPFLFGQTNSVFMDGDSFPNVIDYWGPTGMVFLRNPQIRYTYKQGPHELAVAVEHPSNDVDPGTLREIDPNLGAVQGDEKMPDFTAHYRYNADWGHIQVAGILRRVGFDTPSGAGVVDNQPKGSELGWGVNLTSNIKPTSNDVIHLGFVYGHGIASYMNDGGVDLAPGGIASNISTVHAEAQPLWGVIAYLDHKWNKSFASSIGYSRTQVDNSSLQADNAYRSGQYASVNLLWTPDKHLLFGGELLWGQREDKNGASGDDTRIQFSAHYSFSSNDFFQ
jgi:hypothetical protein